jgi:hypothetical protein
LYKAREKVLKGWSLTTAVKLELLQRVAVWEFNRSSRRQLSIFYMASSCSLRDEMQWSSGAQASINQSGLECSEKSCSAQKRWETGPRRSYIRASRTNASHLALLRTSFLPRLCRLRHGQRQRAMKGNSQVRLTIPRTERYSRLWFCKTRIQQSCTRPWPLSREGLEDSLALAWFPDLSLIDSIPVQVRLTNIKGIEISSTVTPSLLLAVVDGQPTGDQLLGPRTPPQQTANLLKGESPNPAGTQRRHVAVEVYTS